MLGQLFLSSIHKLSELVHLAHGIDNTENEYSQLKGTPMIAISRRLEAQITLKV